MDDNTSCIDKDNDARNRFPDMPLRDTQEEDASSSPEPQENDIAPDGVILVSSSTVLISMEPPITPMTLKDMPEVDASDIESVQEPTGREEGQGEPLVEDVSDLPDVGMEDIDIIENKPTSIGDGSTEPTSGKQVKESSSLSETPTESDTPSMSQDVPDDVSDVQEDMPDEISTSEPSSDTTDDLRDGISDSTPTGTEEDSDDKNDRNDSPDTTPKASDGPHPIDKTSLSTTAREIRHWDTTRGTLRRLVIITSVVLLATIGISVSVRQTSQSVDNRIEDIAYDINSMWGNDGTLQVTSDDEIDERVKEADVMDGHPIQAYAMARGEQAHRELAATRDRSKRVTEAIDALFNETGVRDDTTRDSIEAVRTFAQRNLTGKSLSEAENRLDNAIIQVDERDAWSLVGTMFDEDGVTDELTHDTISDIRTHIDGLPESSAKTALLARCDEADLILTQQEEEAEAKAREEAEEQAREEQAKAEETRQRTQTQSTTQTQKKTEQTSTSTTQSTTSTSSTSSSTTLTPSTSSSTKSDVSYSWTTQGSGQAGINAGYMVIWGKDYYAADTKSKYGPLIKSLHAGSVITINGKRIVIDGSVDGNYNTDTVSSIRKRIGNTSAVCIQTCTTGGGPIVVKYGHYE